MPVSSNVSHHPKPHRHGWHLFLVTPFLWHSNIPMLRHYRQVSPAFALRAAALIAQLVCSVAAQSATSRILEAPRLIQRSGFTSNMCPASKSMARSFATPAALASHMPRTSIPRSRSRQAVRASLALLHPSPKSSQFQLRAAASAV